MKANAVIPIHEKTGVSLVRVEETDVGLRLDRFLKRHLPGMPDGLIQKLVRTGQVRLDGGRVKGNQRLEEGGVVRIPPVRQPVEAAGRVASPPLALLKALAGCVLSTGEGYRVINKPAGWPVHGGTGQTVGLIDGLRHLWQDLPHRPELCHRLDRDTSGCLLIATDRRAASVLSAFFRDGRVDKQYSALVRGVPDPGEGVIDSSLMKGVVRSGERMVVAGEGGQSALTRYRVRESFGNAALLAVTLETGRTHQVRAHFQAEGHPLAGDNKYGDRDFNREMKSFGVDRLFLHAESLTFPHPQTGVSVTVTAPLPPAWGRVIERLRENSQK